jgi:hypothetical protein
MTAFVEECRREWKRLGVPDLLAEEMATELEADLAEAEADGVSAAEMLGESVHGASRRPGPRSAASCPSSHNHRRAGSDAGSGSPSASSSSLSSCSPRSR